MKTLSILGMAAAAAFAATTASAVDQPSTSKPDNRDNCFISSQWQGWSASDDGDKLYLRVNTHDIYQLSLTPGSHIRKNFDRFLVNKTRGSDWICNRMDLDLTLSDHQGFKEPIFVESMKKLTPTEVAAIPKKELP